MTVRRGRARLRVPRQLAGVNWSCDHLPGVASSPSAAPGAARTLFCMPNNTELVPELLEAGVHFGHQTKRWNPKMKPYIFEQRNQIYIINLDETVKQLQRATEFLQEVTRRGGKILFVGCKKQAQEATKEAALACGQFYVNQRWLGGTLTNLSTIRKIASAFSMSPLLSARARLQSIKPALVFSRSCFTSCGSISMGKWIAKSLNR